MVGLSPMERTSAARRAGLLPDLPAIQGRGPRTASPHRSGTGLATRGKTRSGAAPPHWGEAEPC
jgi:hypothetical protein